MKGTDTMRRTMKWVVFLLVSFSTMAWSQEFISGWEPPEESDGALGAPRHSYFDQYQSGTVESGDFRLPAKVALSTQTDDADTTLGESGRDSRGDSQSQNPVIRVAKKLGSGVAFGTLGVLTVLTIDDIFGPDQTDPIAEVASFPHIVLLGYTLGAPIGVSAVDSRDKGMLTWAGSVAGWGVARMADRAAYWPLIGATIASELWRKPSQDMQNSRVSGSFSTGSQSGLLATLRF